MFDEQTLDGLADMICSYPVYRTGSELTRFFRRARLSRFTHDGSTRKWWTLDCLRSCSDSELQGVIERLASPKEYSGDQEQVQKALAELNRLLSVEGRAVTLNGIVPVIQRAQPGFSTPPMPEKELKPLPPPDFLRLGLETGVGEILKSRWQEVQKCINAEAFLAATILMGTLLEGILLAVCQRFPKEANTSAAVPRDSKTGKVKHFGEWTLAELIEVAHCLRWVDLDVKKFSHSLREFRNLVHPYQQFHEQCFPDKDTSDISWLVVQAATNDLARVLAAAR